MPWPTVDDFIEAGGVSGTVMAIGISHCKLKTPDNKEIFVPNSTIISEKIINQILGAIPTP